MTPFPTCGNDLQHTDRELFDGFLGAHPRTPLMPTLYGFRHISSFFVWWLVPFSLSGSPCLVARIVVWDLNSNPPIQSTK